MDACSSHHDGTLIVSATDLVGYLACDHLATLELGRVEGLWEKPIRKDDPTIALIQEKGDLHEAEYLASLRASGLSVVEIATGDLADPRSAPCGQALTLEAMRDGADVIFQATFFDGRWRGHADFLFKRPDRPARRSATGATTSRDTKLARSVKAGAILQMCVYADLLEGLQGIAPEWLYVITGDRVRHPHRRTTSRPISDGSARGSTPASRPDWRADRPATYPDPVDHCRVCTGTRCASIAGGPTTTCRSWPGCADWTPSG